MTQQHQQQATPIVPAEPTFRSKMWARAVRDVDSISSHAKTLAAWLANLSDVYGRVDSTVSQLCLLIVNDSGQSVAPATLKRRRKELTDAGWLVLVKRGGKGRGRDFASVYQLAWPGSKTAQSDVQETAHASARKRLTREPHSVTHSVVPLDPTGEREQVAEEAAAHPLGGSPSVHIALDGEERTLATGAARVEDIRGRQHLIEYDLGGPKRLAPRTLGETCPGLFPPDRQWLADLDAPLPRERAS